ncbi:MAG: endonuclease III [candidate division Zixibacteria bacterium]|nr:endonuclease III [candidate division Zixibacteria bacterium]
MNGVTVKKIARIDEVLAIRYGEKAFKRGPDPLTELILTVLSQNTNDVNRDRAFQAMKDRFPDWQAVIDSSSTELAKTIKVGGLARIKSARIIKLLVSIKESRNRLDLDFLRKWSDDEVRDYLLKIKGVGPKTAACVLAFSLGRDIMPVDTHVYRASTRLGILPSTITPDAAHDYFLRFQGKVSLYQFHLNLIGHGRQVCKARKPACDKCDLRRLCKYYSEQIKGQEAAA